MKKIIFVDIPMYEKNKLNYFNTGNIKSQYDKDVLYPINAVLSKEIQENDKIKVILIKTRTGREDVDSQTKKNVRIFEDEFDELLTGKNVCVDYIHLVSEVDESKENHEIRFRNLLDHLEEDAYLYADITFGHKLLPMMVFCVFNFAERFFNCHIREIVYGKAIHDIHTNQAHSGELYDVSPMYHLNNLTNSMEAVNGKEAINALDMFFSL
ncbi:MAG: TM1812 family CRISPR-associated protein [Treponema sp.]|nr:TM1812 family CRISPR-associated protein [Treponema sp.]